MLVNWRMHYLSQDRLDIQPPDKQLCGHPYWFFRYWPEADAQVDILDYSALPGLHPLEQKVLRFYLLQSFRALGRSRHYDLIISHSAQSGVVLAALRRLLGRKMPPHVIIDIGCFNGGRESAMQLAPIKFSARSLSGLIYHASVQKEYYRRHLPWLPARFVPLGVDSDFFQPLDLKVEDYAVAVGNYQRDYRTLMAAWKKLPANRWRLKIIGINKLAGELPPGVELVDRVPIDELKRQIAQARFVVLPLEYKKYAYGQLTLLQAMALAKAVVVSRVPSTTDYVTDGVDALFVNPYDADDMSTKLRRLWEEPERAQALGEAARHTAERFNEAAMAADIHDFIQSVI